MEDSYISFNCAWCGSLHKKKKNEHARRVRLGKTLFFCGLSCAAKHSNKTIPRKTCKRQSGLDRPTVLRKNKSSFKWFLHRVYNRINTKGSSDLDTEYLEALWRLQKGVCPLTGWELILPKTTGGFRERSPRNASLDRIDNSIGYLRGNVRYVAFQANMARNVFSDEEVLSFCEAVVSHKR